MLRRVEFERIQFHGSETEEEVEAVDLPVDQGVRAPTVEAAETYPGTILLLDHPTQGGGQGPGLGLERGGGPDRRAATT